MTRAVRDRILKDANGGDISDHLRNHIHLTNCIHLKNHMHKHSPISMTDRSLIRDLVVLQRSRSLRDPSMSPPSWQSPSAVDLLSRRGERDAVVENGRRSIGIERQSDKRRLSGNSPTLVGGAMPKGDPGDGSGNSGVRERRRHKRGESSGRQLGIDLMGGRVESPVDANNFVHDQVLGNFETREVLSKQKGSKDEQDDHLKTLSEQLNEVPMDSDNVASSHNHIHGRRSLIGKTTEEAEASVRSHGNGRNRVKRRKYRGGRRTRATIASRDGGTQNEMLSVASNSFAHGPSLAKYRLEEGEEEYAEQNVTRAPGNGCGIPWNWSRIHDRGKTFLDIAGRSLSCGLSDPRSKRDGPPPRGRDFSMPVMSDHSSSSTKSGGEALPLLIDGSQGSTENAAWVHDYSGELGIFADNLLKREMDSDLASEGRSGDHRNKFRGNNSRHQNLTQRYMPRTFRDLVGQNLVVQALSNAVAKRKVGLLYVFYGPHGTGKTSCARTFARALNCLSVEQPRPCGFCDSCVAHDVGKSRNIREVGPVSNLGFKNIMELLENMIVPQLPSQYRVFIFDDCDNLSPECWSAISKVIDRAPRRVVFVLVSSSLDVLPHIIISRCQKFFFPKLKDADIIYTLQWIATKEDFDIDKDALKLIASRSDGSLRDAEMTLEQLSLLGQRISVPLVQELVGLISDEKLVDLLDLALSADTVNTVKTLREIMESGVEPLALMSQLATVITDILAGSYDFRKEKPRRKFFRRQSLLKEDMEKLRQALKTLSEAEKQLRLSNDRLTWLTAALLQLAPDQQYMLPSSSADTSLHQSPLGFNIAGVRDRPRKSNVDPAEMLATQREFTKNVRLENHKAASSSDAYPNMKGGGSSSVDRKGYAAVDRAGTSSKQAGKIRQEIEELWLEVLGRIQTNSLKEFLYQEGKLISISFGEVPCVLLMFSSHLTKLQAEKFGEPILKAFEYVLGQPVTIEIRCSRKDVRAAADTPVTLPGFQKGSSHMYPSGGLLGNKRSPLAGDNDIRRVLHDRDHLTHDQLLHFDSNGMGRSEIIEIEASSREPKIGNTELSKREVDGSWTGETAPSNKNSKIVFFPEEKKLGEQNQSQSLVRGKVSLAHVIQQAEGGWSKRKAVSIAEKLEQENLRLEPRSRNLLCWRASRVTRRKLSRLKIRTRKPKALLRLVSCGKCLSARSPR